jgi:hypothetical protein
VSSPVEKLSASQVRLCSIKSVIRINARGLFKVLSKRILLEDMSHCVLSYTQFDIRIHTDIVTLFACWQVSHSGSNATGIVSTALDREVLDHENVPGG